MFNQNSSDNAMNKIGISEKIIKKIAAMLIIGLTVLAIRIFWLQTLKRHELVVSALENQATTVMLSDNRGIIFDRNKIPLTLHYSSTIAVVLPKQLKDMAKVCKKLSAYTGEGEKTIFNRLKNGEMQIFKLNITPEQAAEGLAEHGIKLFEGVNRYSESSIARHVIGTLNNKGDGSTGIEKAFDYYLNGTGGKGILLYTDLDKKQLTDSSAEVIEWGNKGNNIVLTIDYAIQGIVEDTFNKKSQKGAVIVTDAANGDVLAACSAPSYDQNNVAKYLNKNDGELLNRLNCAYEPGSIFKLVLVAAALEQGNINQNTKFFCDGAAHIKDVNIACHNPKGHGTQDLKQALANSCNPAFIDLGQRLGYNSIYNMAYNMGFGRSVGLYIAHSSQPGNLPQIKEYPQAAVANISIGQGDILVTPVQVAQLLQIIASNGVKKPLNLVSGVSDGIGNVIKSLKRSEENRVIDPKTAQALIDMMHEVTKNGTGFAGSLEELGGCAGKTGTAQSGWMGEDKSPMMHAWFGGIFPVNNPKYCITVFVENGKQGNNVAGAIFGEIARKIMNR